MHTRQCEVEHKRVSEGALALVEEDEASEDTEGGNGRQKATSKSNARYRRVESHGVGRLC